MHFCIWVLEQFHGVLACDLRHVPRKVALKRAEGKLGVATAIEVHTYFHLPLHANVVRVLDTVDYRGLTLLAMPFEDCGALKGWIQRREAAGMYAYRCLNGEWEPAPPIDVSYATVGFSPVWGPDTVRPKPYKAPAAESSLRWTNRPPPRRRKRVVSPLPAGASTSAQGDDRLSGAPGGSAGQAASTPSPLQQRSTASNALEAGSLATVSFDLSTSRWASLT